MTPLLLAVALSMAPGQTSAPPKTAAAPKKAPPHAATRTASPEFDKAVKEAAAARDAGRIDDSIALYQKAVKLRPSYVEGYWSLGTEFYDLDKYAEAKDAFGHVVRLQPKHALAYGFKGLCEFQLKQYDEALDDLTHSTDLGVSSPKDLLEAITYHSAITFTRLGKYEFALQT